LHLAEGLLTTGDVFNVRTALMARRVKVKSKRVQF